MSERKQGAEARVEGLARELRRLGGGLLEVAADHPDPARARELSAAARVLMNSVLERLESDGGTAEPRDAVPVPVPVASTESGDALQELVGMYTSEYDRELGAPVMTDPSLSWEEQKPLRRFGYGDEAYFRTAPLWNDAVPGRGKGVVRGMTSKTEVLRRMHHRYVLARDLTGSEGELAVRVLLGGKAVLNARVIRDGGFIDRYDLERELAPLQWRALVLAAERGAGAEDRLREVLTQLETLAAAVLDLDVLFRRQTIDPSLAAAIPGAVQVVQAIVKDWPVR
ncbi:hypothetical protein ABT127_34335 [Streptomyces sp. NPDC001904]|uniref:hypothetical protein n=1 Tax=Streptomyces sp. NPDC001904 TaxID=3154531 RepID=UPI00332638BA